MSLIIFFFKLCLLFHQNGHQRQFALPLGAPPQHASPFLAVDPGVGLINSNFRLLANHIVFLTCGTPGGCRVMQGPPFSFLVFYFSILLFSSEVGFQFPELKLAA